MQLLEFISRGKNKKAKIKNVRWGYPKAKQEDERAD